MSWWAAPSLQANRAEFARAAMQRTEELRPKTFSNPYPNTLTYADELALKTEFKKRATERQPKAAETKLRASKLFACQPAAPVPSCVQQASLVPIVDTKNLEVPTMQLVLRNRLKSGSATYGIPGVNGLVRIDRKLFAEGSVAPDLLEVGYDGFVQPNAEQSEKASARAAKRAEREAKIAERAAKAQERAKKAQERADKLSAQAAKAAGKSAPEGDSPASE